MNMDGKVALVTGSTNGIGRATGLSCSKSAACHRPDAMTQVLIAAAANPPDRRRRTHPAAPETSFVDEGC